MPQFPEFDPETLAQAIKTFVLARNNNRTAVSQLSRPDYFDVVRGWAEALGFLQNPSFAYLDNNDQTLFNLIGQGGGQTQTPSLLFNIQGALSVGQWAVQVSDDTVAAADATTFANGPVVGVVIDVPSTGIARIQNTGSYTYPATAGFSFLPMTADEVYYASPVAVGDITLTPTPPSGGFMQEVGYAKTPYQFIIAIQEPVEV